VTADLLLDDCVLARSGRSKLCSRRSTVRHRAPLRGTSSVRTCSSSTPRWRTRTSALVRSASSCRPSPLRRRTETRSCVFWTRRLMARLSAAVKTDSSHLGRQTCSYAAASPSWYDYGRI